jgi:hypothetical protein
LHLKVPIHARNVDGQCYHNYNRAKAIKTTLIAHALPTSKE